MSREFVLAVRLSFGMSRTQFIPQVQTIIRPGNAVCASNGLRSKYWLRRNFWRSHDGQSLVHLVNHELRTFHLGIKRVTLHLLRTSLGRIWLESIFGTSKRTRQSHWRVLRTPSRPRLAAGGSSSFQRLPLLLSACRERPAVQVCPVIGPGNAI